MSARQLPLDLGHSPALSEGDFLVAPCNAQAHAWLCAWPQWPVPAAAVFGPAGCGKTHLAHVFAGRSGARIVPAADLNAQMPPALVDGVAAVVVEDCDSGRLDEVALFHLVNLARETGCGLLLTGRDAPARWALDLPDLRSRVAAMPALAIGAPDDAVLAAVLVKLFADRQLAVGDGLIAYLLGRMERSFAACTRLVSRLDQQALAERCAVGVPLARRILDMEDGNGPGTEGA